MLKLIVTTIRLNDRDYEKYDGIGTILLVLLYLLTINTILANIVWIISY